MKAILCIFMLCTTLSLHGTIKNSLDRIKERSEISQSDAIVVLRHGKPLIVQQTEDCAGIDSMEMTKPLVGLAIALLLDEGLIPCLDQPLYIYYPEWQFEPYKKEMTLRHLIANTSGLNDSKRDALLENPLEAILCSELLFQPGARYDRNAKNILLLIDIIKRASGKEFTQYLYQRLFSPLGIDDIAWRTGGTVDALPQFQMTAWDLAKIGVLIANEGSCKGKQIISKRWLNAVLSPSQTFNPFFGWQWWLEYYDIAAWWDDELLKEYSEQGISPELIRKLTTLQGRVIHFSGQVYGNQIIKLRGQGLISDFENGELMAQLIHETYAKGLPLARFKTGKMKMASAHGQGGQHLIIMPQQGLVAVRQKRIDPYGFCHDKFDDLPNLMEEVAKACDAYID